MDTDSLMTGRLSSTVDQYTFDSIPGAQSALEHHWSTFFTSSDVADIASAGFNALRIPIGFWAYDNSGLPYITGADAYLEKAIMWARSNRIWVLIDLHGSPGSQNGFDNSGRQGNVEWQQPDNLQRSINILVEIAMKYGSTDYADVVLGLELVNEPISWNQNKFSVTKSWAKDAYKAVTRAAANPNFRIIMHDAFMDPSTNWMDAAEELYDYSPSGLGPHNDTVSSFGIDTHPLPSLRRRRQSAHARPTHRQGVHDVGLYPLGRKGHGVPARRDSSLVSGAPRWNSATCHYQTARYRGRAATGKKLDASARVRQLSSGARG